MRCGSLRERTYSKRLARDVAPCVVDRYSEGRESSTELSKRVNRRGL